MVSTAIAADNPELAEARRRGLPVLHRSELLAELMAGRRGLAVAGAHGKSTTSARCWSPPSATPRPPWARRSPAAGDRGDVGRWPWFVAEADESDRSLLNLAPEAAILLNVDHDHHATFASLEDVREVFRAFVARLPARLLVRGPTTRRGPAPAAPAARCGSSATPGAWGRVSASPGGGASCWRRRRRAGRGALALAGRHNADNAACALALADWCGVPLEEAPGAWRASPGWAGGWSRGRAGGGGGRRLRPPPGRDPGHPGGGPRAGAGPDRRRLPAPPALAHARSGPRSGRRSGRPTSSW